MATMASPIGDLRTEQEPSFHPYGYVLLSDVMPPPEVEDLQCGGGFSASHVRSPVKDGYRERCDRRDAQQQQ